MRPRVSLILLTMLLALPAGARTRTDPGRGLAAAGRQTLVSAIDQNDDACDAEETVGAWLKTLTGRDARSIVWTGGACQLTQDSDPGLSVRGWPYCAQARVTLANPWEAGDQPMIEIWFQQPADGQIGAPFAFRGLIKATLEGRPELVRDRQSFVADWRARFPASAGSKDCEARGQ